MEALNLEQPDAALALGWGFPLQDAAQACGCGRPLQDAALALGWGCPLQDAVLALAVWAVALLRLPAATGQRKKKQQEE